MNGFNLNFEIGTYFQRQKFKKSVVKPCFQIFIISGCL